jgi:uncharacterized membrane protein
MRGGSTLQMLQRIQDDPLVSLLVTLLAYSLGRLFAAAVTPDSPVGTSLWVLLAVTLGCTILLAARRRRMKLLIFSVLSAVGMAGVVVGIGRTIYMAVETPRWLLSFPAVCCYALAAIGILSLHVARISDDVTGGAA